MKVPGAMILTLAVVPGAINSLPAAYPKPFAELNPQRIAAIEGMLPDKPSGFGRPITDRAYWNDPKIHALLGDVVGRAEKLLGKPFPEWSDDLYLDFKKTGRRPPGEKMLSARAAWLYPLVLAECLEDKGRFLPTLSMALEEYIKEPTWTLPAHDGNLDNFNRKHYTIELRSAGFSANLAETLYLLGERLDPTLRQRLTDTIDERCIKTVRESLTTGKGNHFLVMDNNWNAVCLAGVVGTVVTIVPDRHERAVFIAAGEYYSSHFLGSFGKDGYCDEGGGYWSYGFGSFVNLREVIMHATGGRIDLFSDPKICNIALFGVRFQLNDRLVPPYADCRYGTRANLQLVAYCNEALQLGVPGLSDVGPLDRGDLAMVLMEPTRCVAPPTVDGKLVDIRSYFDNAGVLVCRPSSPTSRLAASIKAGGNGSHSHNDIGSFIIILGKDLQIGEPGGPVAYNSQTFGPNRYTFKILNSFGHPVPVVAGKLQLDATKVKPVVLRTSFTDQQDEISIDFKQAYDVPELKKLVRTMRFDRRGSGIVTIEDEVEFSVPATFETALTTRGKVQQRDPPTLHFDEGTEQMDATIETPDGFTVTREDIEEMDCVAYTRLGVKLLKPVTKAIVRMTFRPL